MRQHRLCGGRVQQSERRVRRRISAAVQFRLGVEAELFPLAGLEGWRAGGLEHRQQRHWSPWQTIGGYVDRQPHSAQQCGGYSTLRLNDWWLQGRVVGRGLMRFGQLAAESEFAVPNTAFNLVNGTFGWLLSLAEALPV
jgi:hypothetical protein